MIRFLGEGMQNAKLLNYLVKRMGDKIDVLRGIADDVHVDMVLDDIEHYWDELKQIIVEFTQNTL